MQLREELAAINPAALGEFDQSHEDALTAQAQGDDQACAMWEYRWRVHIEMRSTPERAAHVAGLEAAVGQAATVNQAREQADQLARLVDDAVHRVGPPGR